MSPKITTTHFTYTVQIFLRAIGANWLVCLAVFLSISARDIASKIIAIWFPTACFVSLALDHVVANMFFIPTGIWVGAPFSAGYYIYKSLIPTLLGNMVGGGFFVGFMYWYLYLTGEENVTVEFNLGSLESAMEAGGPIRHYARGIQAPMAGATDGVSAAPMGGQQDDEEKVIEGRNPSSSSASSMHGAPAPNPYQAAYGHYGQQAMPGAMPGVLVSAFGKEMSDSGPYSKTWAERMAEKKSKE